MIIDKLFKAVEEKGHVCVGLDTDISYIPEKFVQAQESTSEAIFQFNKRIIDATVDVAACFKVQIAYYEALGLEGLIAYKKTLEYLRSKDTITIADIKRGDISKTAEMYAKGHFEGDFEADFITLSPYMGLDSIEPFLKYIESGEKGVFPLIRTSNEGAKDIQYIKDENGERIFNVVGKKIQDMAHKYIGECGYSPIGGVVGCTHREEAVEIRKTLHEMFFLIPGYGAQGGGAEDVKALLKDGNGGVVNSSRGILLAYKNHEDGEDNFEKYAREEAIKMREAIRNVI